MKIHAIYDTLESRFVAINQSRVAFSHEATAKGAFGRHKKWGVGGFDKQKRFVVVELTEGYFRLKDLEE